MYHPIENLLVTKLERPFIDTRIVRRDSLTQLLKVSSEQCLTLVIAPPGYGKTTLLVEWLSIPNGHNHNAVWLTCDQFDNVPLRFWAYVISGLEKACPEFHFHPQQLIQEQHEQNDLTSLNPLLNQIAAVPHHITIVLDDYHTITNPDIQYQVGYFIEHLPHNLNLILSGRVMPPIALSRLRAQHRLLEITERDLAFSLSEAQSFFVNVMNLDIPQEQIVTLWNSTEGWIAGLQLAALSYFRSGAQLPSPHVLHDNRMVLDYFTEEVLNQQNTRVREFLLKSSLLEELSAPLCNAVLGCSDSEHLLGEIEEANLFMVCLDNRCGYRYHSLFAQVLQTRLRQTYPQDVSKLHLNACNWFLKHHQLDKAIPHALAAGALEEAAVIVEMCATEAFLRNDLIRLVHWLFILKKDPDMLTKHPRLAIYDALTNYHLQRLERVHATLCEIEQIFRDKKKPFDATDRLVQWQASAIQAVLECSQGDKKKGISELLAILADRPAEDHYFLGFITHTLALTYKDVGNLEAAAHYFHEAFRHTMGHSPSAIQSLCASASIRKRQAHLREAQHRYHEAFELTKDLQNEDSIVALALAGLLDIAFEQNHMEQADDWVAKVLAHRRRIVANPSAWMWMGLTAIDFILVRYYLALGDSEAATEHFKELKKYVPANLLADPDMLQQLIEVQTLLGLAIKHLPIETHLVSEVEAYLEEKPKLSLLEQLTRARIYRAQQQLGQALTVLDCLETQVRQTEEKELFINLLILKSLVCRELCQDDKALKSIDEALLIAEPNGYVRAFINEGDTMRQLLQLYSTTSKDNKLQSYVERLITIFNAKSNPVTDSSAKALPMTTRLSGNMPDLSQRELEVLHMLTTALSYKEIAAALTISVNTVKIHIKSVFRKLDAHSRKAAIVRAKELKFLDDKLGL